MAQGFEARQPGDFAQVLAQELEKDLQIAQIGGRGVGRGAPLDLEPGPPSPYCRGQIRLRGELI